MQRVLDGDVDAFEGIVQRWQGPLIQLAYRFSRDREVAEELAQEALVKLFRNLHRWRSGGRFSTWMFAVALNVYRSWARKKRPLFDPLDKVGALVETWQGAGVQGTAGRPGDAPGAAAALLQREESELVRRAVLALPEKYRDAILVFYFQEEDLQTTAEVLGRPVGTVKAHLFRGRKLLEKRLGPRSSRGHPASGESPGPAPPGTGGGIRRKMEMRRSS